MHRPAAATIILLLPIANIKTLGLESPAMLLARAGDRVKRREFITLLGGAAVVWPFAARARHKVIAMIRLLAIRRD
jgi:hypothetical protein